MDRSKGRPFPSRSDNALVTVTEARESPASALVSHFLQAVRIPGSTFSTLQQFLESLEKDAKPMVTELGRRSTGAEVSTLLKDATKLKAVDIALIFTVLDKILLTIISDLQTLETFALELAEHLILKNLGTFYYMLKTTNKSNQIKSALKVLISVCTLGPKTVKLFLTHFSFAKCGFSNLVTRRNTVDPQDIRACSIQLLVAVMMFGENLAVRQLAQTRNVIAAVFLGLVVDRANLIRLFLSTLLDKVVKNTTVSKTQKVQLFNQTSLKQLARVLSWNGQYKSEKEFVEDDAVSKADPMERAAVRDAALQFLLVVCSSVKYGIVFQDLNNGATSKNGNHVLTEFLRTLNFQSPYHRELARSMLIAAPDQLAQFLPSWKPGFVPRSSDKWREMMTWLDNVLADIDVASRAAKAPPKAVVPACCALVMPATFDSDLQREAFSDSQSINVASVFSKFLSGALVRLFRVSLAIPAPEKPAFVKEIQQRIIDPIVITQFLEKKSSDVLTDATEEEKSTFFRYAVLYTETIGGFEPKNLLSLLEGHMDSSELTIFSRNIREELQKNAESVVASGGIENLGHVSVETLKKQRVQLESEAELQQTKESTTFWLLRTALENSQSLTPEVMDVLMCSYGASLSAADQNIFLTLRALDDGGNAANIVSFSLFGKSAQRHSQVHKSQGVFLPYQPSLREFVDGLDGRMLMKTAVEFPIRLTLFDASLISVCQLDVYDPRYLLSNFIAVLQKSKTQNTVWVTCHPGRCFSATDAKAVVTLADKLTKQWLDLQVQHG